MISKRINFSDRLRVKPDDIEKENNSIRRQITALSSRVSDLESMIGDLDGVSIRCGSVSVIAGTNFVRFSKPLKTTTYAMVKPYLYVDSGTSGDVTINDQQRHGFTCWCSDPGTLKYNAIE
jgi:hypothetical protein